VSVTSGLLQVLTDSYLPTVRFLIMILESASKLANWWLSKEVALKV